MVFLSNLVNGISLGSIYAIIALGYTMVYGIAKMLNFAHGDVIMVGAYIVFCATQYWNLPPAVSIIAAMLVCTLLGITIEKLAYKPLRQVTGIWEDWYDGTEHLRREEYYLPGDWEFLPWEGQSGDYTIYMNEGYTRPYFYPGDGMDYTLYLTTAKG